MALSIPVIATRVSAIPEVVADGKTGWVVPPRNADAIAAALREALTQPGERHRRGAAGRVRLETHFSVERMVSRTLDVYHSLEAGS